MRKSALALTSALFFAPLLYVPAASAQDPAAPKPPPAPEAKPPQNPPATADQPASPFKDQKEKLSYALGLSIGGNLKRQFVEVDPDVMLRGLKDGLDSGKALMSDDEVRATITQMQSELKAKMEEKARLAAVANKKEGDEFLEANKTKEGVVALPSGLQYKILTQGTGPTPVATDTVSCNYRGTLIDGTEFDSSYKRGQPASFRVSGVIKGWTEALQLMPVGSKWQLFIPSSLAYGERGQGPIGPNAMLIFEVELISIQGKP
jgi:FKBP-type peptidyl-prolyl cis-trans isomerase FklB